MEIQKVLRPCIVQILYVSNEAINALFHEWTNDNDAIVELANGKCYIVSMSEIQFTDDKLA